MSASDELMSLRPHETMTGLQELWVAGRSMGSADVLLTTVGVTILGVTPADGAPDNIVAQLVDSLVAQRPPRLQHFGIRRLHTLRWYQSSGPRGAVLSGVLKGRPQHDMPVEMLDLSDGEGMINLTLYWEDGYEQLMHAVASLDATRAAWSRASERGRNVLLRRAVLDVRFDRGQLWAMHMVALRDLQPQVRLYASKQLLRNLVWEPDANDMLLALDEPMSDPLGFGERGDPQHTRRNVRTAIVYILGRLVSSARSSSAAQRRRDGSSRVHRRLIAQAPLWSAQDDRSAWRRAATELQGGAFATGQVGPLPLFALCRTLIHRHRILLHNGVAEGERLSWLYAAVVELIGGLHPATHDAMMAASPETELPELSTAQRHAITRR
jgi:hypothetical protein